MLTIECEHEKSERVELSVRTGAAEMLHAVSCRDCIAPIFAKVQAPPWGKDVTMIVLFSTGARMNVQVTWDMSGAKPLTGKEVGALLRVLGKIQGLS